MTTKTLKLIFGGVLAGVFAGGVQAQSTSSDPRRCSRTEFTFCLNGVGSAVTSLDSARLSGSVAGAAARESKDAKEHASLGASGLSAGDNFAGFGVWGSWNYSDFESDVAIAPYDAQLHNWLFGVDHAIGDRFVLGVALGGERLTTSTRYNGGGADGVGVTIAPYALVAFNDVLSADVSVGYTRLYTDQERVDTNNGASITSDYDADRVFGAANLNALWLRGSWVFGARIGYLYTAESQDAYQETGGATARRVRSRHIDLSQAYVGADVAYSMGAWEPYAIASYHNDLSRDDGNTAGGLPGAVGRTQPDDDDEYRFGLGLRYFGDSGVTGALEWMTTTDRDRFSENSVNLTVRVDL